MPKTFLSTFSALLLLQFLGLYAAAATIGTCHPYPGAAAQDCLKLVGDHLNDIDKPVPCVNGLATLTYQACSITTRCVQGQTSVVADDAVRRAWTAMGACALSDHGSISGSYTADDGSTTCYLYPGREGSC